MIDRETLADLADLEIDQQTSAVQADLAIARAILAARVAPVRLAAPANPAETLFKISRVALPIAKDGRLAPGSS